MGKRLNRTLLNWRWYVVLPVAPISLALCALQWLFRLPMFALDNAEQVSRRIFNWARKGGQSS